MLPFLICNNSRGWWSPAGIFLGNHHALFLEHMISVELSTGGLLLTQVWPEYTIPLQTVIGSGMMRPCKATETPRIRPGLMLKIPTYMVLLSRLAVGAMKVCSGGGIPFASTCKEPANTEDSRIQGRKKTEKHRVLMTLRRPLVPDKPDVYLWRAQMLEPINSYVVQAGFSITWKSENPDWLAYSIQQALIEDLVTRTCARCWDYNMSETELLISWESCVWQ